MGEVYKPEAVARKKVRIPDIHPQTPPAPPPMPPTLEDVSREVQELREEIMRIKRALERQGILVD